MCLTWNMVKTYSGIHMVMVTIVLVLLFAGLFNIKAPFDAEYNIEVLKDNNTASCVDSQNILDQNFSYQVELNITYSVNAEQLTGIWYHDEAVILNVYFNSTVMCEERKVQLKLFVYFEGGVLACFIFHMQVI